MGAPITNKLPHLIEKLTDKLSNGHLYKDRNNSLQHNTDANPSSCESFHFIFNRTLDNSTPCLVLSDAPNSSKSYSRKQVLEILNSNSDLSTEDRDAVKYLLELVTPLDLSPLRPEEGGCRRGTIASYHEEPDVDKCLKAISFLLTLESSVSPQNRSTQTSSSSRASYASTPNLFSHSNSPVPSSVPTDDEEEDNNPEYDADGASNHSPSPPPLAWTNSNTEENEDRRSNHSHSPSSLGGNSDAEEVDNGDGSTSSPSPSPPPPPSPSSLGGNSDDGDGSTSSPSSVRPGSDDSTSPSPSPSSSSEGANSNDEEDNDNNGSTSPSPSPSSSSSSEGANSNDEEDDDDDISSCSPQPHISDFEPLNLEFDATRQPAVVPDVPPEGLSCTVRQSIQYDHSDDADNLAQRIKTSLDALRGDSD